MKVTAYTLLLFYVCLNISFWTIQETQVIPTSLLPSLETPTAIQNKLIGSALSGAIVGTLLSAIVGNFLYGATAGLIVFIFQLFMGENNILDWVFNGLPNYVTIMVEAYGLDSTLTTVFGGIIVGLSSVVWFWFIIQLVTGRHIET